MSYEISDERQGGRQIEVTFKGELKEEQKLALRELCKYDNGILQAASNTIANVLKKVKAKYVYGVTAPPKRSDGLEKINNMLLGPIRYRYTAKERAEAQGIEHLVYPRFTRTVSPRGILTEKMHPNEAYEILRNNEIRDEQILSDVKKCIEDHSQKSKTPQQATGHQTCSAAELRGL